MWEWLELLLPPPPPNELLNPPLASIICGTGRTSSVRIFFGRPRFFFGGWPFTKSAPFMAEDELDDACTAKTFDCFTGMGVDPSVRIFLGRPRFFFTGNCPANPSSMGSKAGRFCCWDGWCGCSESAENSLAPTRAGRSSDDRESTNQNQKFISIFKWTKKQKK